jgi:hypothetical protein
MSFVANSPNTKLSIHWDKVTRRRHNHSPIMGLWLQHDLYKTTASAWPAALLRELHIGVCRLNAQPGSRRQSVRCTSLIARVHKRQASALANAQNGV